MDDSKKDDYMIHNTSNNISNGVLDYKTTEEGKNIHSLPSFETSESIANYENNISSICIEVDAKNSEKEKAELRSSSSVDDIYCWVLRTENARGRRWQDVGPLTLSLLKHELQRQHPQLPELTPANARLVCSLPDSLSLQLCGELRSFRECSNGGLFRRTAGKTIRYIKPFRQSEGFDSYNSKRPQAENPQ